MVLAAQVRAGVLQFALTMAFEPGFAGRPQYGPSLQSSAPSDVAPLLKARLAAETKPRLSVLQSDEGGRFMTSRVRYRVIWLEDEPLPAEDAMAWVSAAGLEQLCRRPGVLTNEARSAASLLLTLC